MSRWLKAARIRSTPWSEIRYLSRSDLGASGGATRWIRIRYTPCRESGHHQRARAWAAMGNTLYELFSAHGAGA